MPTLNQKIYIYNPKSVRQCCRILYYQNAYVVVDYSKEFLLYFKLCKSRKTSTTILSCMGGYCPQPNVQLYCLCSNSSLLTSCTTSPAGAYIKLSVVLKNSVRD